MTVSRLQRAFLVLPLASLPLLAPGCRSAGNQLEQEVVSAVQHGRYEEALESARRLAEKRPDDPRVQALQRDAMVAYVLDRGRTEVFHGDLERGLEYFESAAEISPDHPTVQNWILKTRTQLADHWLDVAADCTGPEQLGEAADAFERVLRYDPDNADARRGLARVLLLQNYRSGMSKTYFDDGLSTFHQLLLQQAHRSFTISRRYQENDAAAMRSDQVEKMMADERLASARNLEESGLWFAARNEYRLVLLIDPSNADARTGLDRMDRETRATRTLAEADMEIRRGKLEQAEDDLGHAETLTESQTDQVSLLQNDIEEKRLDEMYLEAQSYYRDYRYPEAVEAYKKLLAIAPDYKDAALRMATVEEFIRLAEEFYAKALAAKDDAEAEEYLRAIHPVIYPEYRDVVERLAAIEARKAKAAQADGGAAATPKEPQSNGSEPR